LSDCISGSVGGSDNTGVVPAGAGAGLFFTGFFTGFGGEGAGVGVAATLGAGSFDSRVVFVVLGVLLFLFAMTLSKGIEGFA
jgi:hypothetical protein